MKNILANIFSNHMILQRRKPICFWGTVQPLSKVDLAFANIKKTTLADEKGYWSMTFPSMEATTGLSLTAEADGLSVTYQDIAIGEVWLAGGQSNMEFSLEQSTEWAQFKEPSTRNALVRFFYTPKYPYRNKDYDKAFEEAEWQLTDSEGFKDWSSVGYQFAAHLAEKLSVPVGIIGCNWGGTSASAWMSREAIMASEDTRIYIEEFEQGIEGQSLKDQLAAYDQYEVDYNEWNRKCGELYAENPSIDWDEVNRILGQCQWPGPMNMGNPFRPCGLYDQMLMEICPYTLAGFIYYQGESDDHRPQAYHHLFTNMVKNWRQSWKDDTLPFIVTQLPMHRYCGSPDFRNWPIIREAQFMTYQELSNMGIAIVPDCGEWSEIHPKSKKTVAERLALQALCHVYQCLDEEDAMAPYYDHKECHDGRIDLYFSFAKEGLTIKEMIEPEEVAALTPNSAYEIAGIDCVFHNATATVNGNCVTLVSERVPEPVYARYLWYNYCLPTLYNTKGFPVAPFRTDVNEGSDSFSGFDSIQQIMET